MLKKLLLITSAFLVEAYSSTYNDGAAPAAQAAASAQVSARVYPSLSADNYHDIFAAAQEGDMNAVQEFIKNNVDPTADRGDGWTVLHSAANSGNLPLVRHLVEDLPENQRLNPNRGTVLVNGWTILHSAANSRNFNLVQYFLVVHRLNPREVDQDKTLLNYIVSAGNLDVVQYFVEVLPENQRLDATAVNANGWTALHSAAGSGKLDVVQYFVEGLPENQRLDVRAVNLGEVLQNYPTYPYFHILAYFADLGLEIPVAFRQQVNLIRQRARQAFKFEHTQELVAKGETVHIPSLLKVQDFIKPIGVSDDNIENKRYISSRDIFNWYKMSDEERSLIKTRIKDVQSEEYLFYVLEKSRLRELERQQEELKKLEQAKQAAPKDNRDDGDDDA